MLFTAPHKDHMIAAEVV